MNDLAEKTYKENIYYRNQEVVLGQLFSFKNTIYTTNDKLRLVIVYMWLYNADLGERR